MIPIIPAITKATVKLVINSLLIPEDGLVEDGVVEDEVVESSIQTSPSRTVPGPHL